MIRNFNGGTCLTPQEMKQVQGGGPPNPPSPVWMCAADTAEDSFCTTNQGVCNAYCANQGLGTCYSQPDFWGCPGWPIE